MGGARWYGEATVRGSPAEAGKYSHPWVYGEALSGRDGWAGAQPGQTAGQSMAATRHRSTARRFVSSACPR